MYPLSNPGCVVSFQDGFFGRKPQAQKSRLLKDAKDIVIVPRRTYRDPFRPGDNIIVLADTYEDRDNTMTCWISGKLWCILLGC